MASHSHRIIAIFAWLVFFAQAAYGVKFTQREFKYAVPTKGPVTLDLRSVLKEVAAGQSVRFVPHNLPAWLAYDATNLRLTGSPTTNETVRFGVEVYQGSSSDFSFFEYTVYTAPKFLKAALDLGTQWEGRLWTLDLKSLVDNPSRFNLGFTASHLPKWMSLSGDRLTGTPTRADVGTYTGIGLQVSGPYGSSASATAGGRVAKVPSAPKWTKDAVTLDDALEDQVFERVLVEFVSNPDGVPLQFTLGKHPAWLNLTNVGKLFGVPRRKDIGPAEVEVTITANVAGANVTETAKFAFEVVRVNKAPFFTEDPVLLPKAQESTPYLADLSGFVSDPDLDLGDGLFLEIVSGPAWGSLAPPALLKGTPPVGFLGTQTFRVRVTDASGLSDTATVVLDVIKANKPPEIQPGVQFTVKARQVHTDDLKKYVADPEGELLTFEGLNFPAWAAISPEGRVELKPLATHAGEHTLTVRVGDGNSKATGSFLVTVVKDPRPPVWLDDPVRIDAVSGTPFAVNIADKAQDLDNSPLTFSKTSGPDWLAIDPSGRVGGSPKLGDVGEIRFGILAKNEIGETAATLIVRVRQGNRPPKWAQDPVALGTVKPEVPFQFDLNSFVSDPDGDLLRFTKVIAPPWLRLTLDGRITGTPFQSDLGDFAAVFEVTDGKFSAQVGAKGRVGAGNQAPVLKGDALTFNLKERAVIVEELSDKKFVEDPEGDPLEFRLISAPDWVTISSQGKLTMKPLFAHIGSHTARLEVSDGKVRVEGPVKIHVLRDPRPPIWLEDPIALSTIVGQALSLGLADKAKDLDNQSLTFQKVSGPGWLGLSSSGSISGTPSASDVGMNAFVFRAANDVLSADVRVNVDVRAGLSTLKVPLFTAVEDAPAEIVWLIDHSQHDTVLMPSLYSTIGNFYSRLDAAKIDHVSAVINTRERTGQFVTVADEDPLLRAGDPNLAAAFQRRVEKAYTIGGWNSPIWALSRLHETMQTGGEVPKGFFRNGAPTFLFLLTTEGDYFKEYAKGTPKEHYAPQDFARDIVKFHRRTEQPVSFNTYDMRCPAAYDPANPGTKPAYLQLSGEMIGWYYYMAKECYVRIPTILENFGKFVVDQSRMYAKRRILLPAAATASHLRVVLKKGTELIPLPEEKWHYESKTKEIVIHWDRMGYHLAQGDELQITY